MVSRPSLPIAATGLQKTVEIEDEKKLQNLYDKRLASEVSLRFAFLTVTNVVFSGGGGEKNLMGRKKRCVYGRLW